ncbi:MAG TPA: hypothetical protein VF609_10560 [Flavisolibacter sp.]|jgi:hypothetical protein
MSEAEKKIVAGYASLLGGLSKEARLELINVLSKSLANEINLHDRIPQNFDGFISEKSAEEIIEDLRTSRQFHEKDLNF